MATTLEKALRFQSLHERTGAFVIPNPWDAGSASLLNGLGFEALATTSSGFANTLGRMDGQITLREKVDHCRALCNATDIPISADLENCFADDPEEAAKTITAVAEVGIVGGSIEDHSGNADQPIYDFGLAVERVAAAAEAASALDFPFMLTARAENLLHKRNDLDDTIRRLQAYENAGAHVLYAPGLRSLEDVATVAKAVNNPINVLSPFLKGFTVSQLAQAGAKRISIGGALARAVTATLLKAGHEMLEQGSFTWTQDLADNREIASLFNR